MYKLYLACTAVSYPTLLVNSAASQLNQSAILASQEEKHDSLQLWPYLLHSLSFVSLIQFSLCQANCTIQDCAFCTCFCVCVCVRLFFNLSLKLPSCYCFLFFLLKCLPYFRENGIFRLNVLNFTTHDTTCPQNVSGQYCTSKSLEMISESKLFVSSLKFASEKLLYVH